MSGGLAQRLCKAAVELDAAAATVWEEALDYERVDLAEACCPPDSVLASTMLEVGGSARRHSWWNGFDLVTRVGAEKLHETLRKARPRVIWASPPGDDTSKPEDQGNPEKATNLAAQRRRNRRIQQNLSWLLCALYAEGWCEVRSAGETGLSRVLAVYPCRLEDAVSVGSRRWLRSGSPRREH